MYASFKKSGCNFATYLEKSLSHSLELEILLPNRDGQYDGNLGEKTTTKH